MFLVNSLLKIIVILFIIFWKDNLLFSQVGCLNIISPDSGLIVSLNDSIIGTTPLNFIKVDSGSHKLSISNPQKGMWKYDDWEQQIQIYIGDTINIKPTFKQNFIIRSNPFDAQVFINDRYYGNTPLYLDFFPSNEILKIKKECYKPYSINLVHITSSSLNITLEPNEALHRTFQNEQFKKERRLQRNKKLTYSFLAFTVCSGLATAYFKNQAELKYNQYLTAGNLKDMNRYYNDTKKLDKISAISFTLFEASFALSFYFLIKAAGD